jgi:hypothetical protein
MTILTKLFLKPQLVLRTCPSLAEELLKPKDQGGLLHLLDNYRYPQISERRGLWREEYLGILEKLADIAPEFIKNLVLTSPGLKTSIACIERPDIYEIITTFPSFFLLALPEHKNLITFSLPPHPAQDAPTTLTAPILLIEPHRQSTAHCLMGKSLFGF